MRSSKSRSRSKNNRNRSVGNVMNRVFDSSGPEGKVRGTPQQIIEKYNQLARDAQLANDVVKAENFQQHAEHYTRLLAVAQREQEARREQQEREQRERQQARADQQAARRGGEQNQRRGEGPGEQPQPAAMAPGMGEQPDLIVPAEPAETGLVPTPEEAPAKKRQPRRTRQKAAASDASSDTGAAQKPESPEAAE